MRRSLAVSGGILRAGQNWAKWGIFAVFRAYIHYCTRLRRAGPEQPLRTNAGQTFAPLTVRKLFADVASSCRFRRALPPDEWEKMAWFKVR
jgi:hypothetical protein